MSFIVRHKEMIKLSGGQSKWNALSENVKADKWAKMVEGILAKLRQKEGHEENEQRFLCLFIWAGCGCHKNLNKFMVDMQSCLQFGLLKDCQDLSFWLIEIMTQLSKRGPLLSRLCT